MTVVAQGQEKTKDEREVIALRRLRDAIRGVKFGTVTVIVQDGVVVQIDRTEKMRMDYSREDIQRDGSGI